MTHRHSVAGGRDIAARWCALAEQRLEHLSDMFETGRWRRYHSEIAFLENIQEAKRAVQIWRALAKGEDVAAASASVASAFGWTPAKMPPALPQDPVVNAQPKASEADVIAPKASEPIVFQPKAVQIAREAAVPVALDPRADVLAEIAEVPVAPATVPAAMAALLPQFSPPADDIVTAPERLVQFTFSLDGLEAKYPLLRNAF